MTKRNQHTHRAPDMKTRDWLKTAFNIYRGELSKTVSRLTDAYVNQQTSLILKKAGITESGSHARRKSRRGTAACNHEPE